MYPNYHEDEKIKQIYDYSSYMSDIGINKPVQYPEIETQPTPQMQTEYVYIPNDILNESFHFKQYRKVNDFTENIYIEIIPLTYSATPEYVISKIQEKNAILSLLGPSFIQMRIFEGYEDFLKNIKIILPEPSEHKEESNTIQPIPTLEPVKQKKRPERKCCITMMIILFIVLVVGIGLLAYFLLKDDKD